MEEREAELCHQGTKAKVQRSDCWDICSSGETAHHVLCGTIKPLACIATSYPGTVGRGQRLGRARTHIYLGEVKPQTLALFDGIQCPIRLCWPASLCRGAAILEQVPLTSQSVVYRGMPLKDHPSRHLLAKRGVEDLKLSPYHVRHWVTKAELWLESSCLPPNSSLQFEQELSW